MINIDLTKEKGLEISFTGQVIGADGSVVDKKINDAKNEITQQISNDYYKKPVVDKKINEVRASIPSLESYATREYVDRSIEDKSLSLDGGTMLGDINMDGKRIDNIGIEEVNSLPTTNLYEGRMVRFKNKTYTFYNGLWLALSDDLRGHANDTHEENFVYQPTASDLSVKDGFADIKKLKGNTVVWNQKLKTSIFETKTISGITITNNNDGSYTLSGVATAEVMFQSALYDINSSHKYLLKGGYSNNVYINLSNDKDNGNGVIGSMNTTEIGYTSFPRIYITSSTDLSTPITIKPQLINLTQMFGEGNEPATVEEFEAMFPNDYYEYNEGELMSFDGKGLKSVGFNAFDGEQAKVLKGQRYYLGGAYTALGFKENENSETIAFELPSDRYYTPTSNGYIVATGENICINLSHSGYRNGEYEPYEDYKISLQDGKTISQLTGKLNGEGESVTIFPDGLRSAGTAYDEIVYDEATGKHYAYKRIGSVDMGTLNWKYNDGSSSPDKYPYGYFTFIINNIKAGTYVLTTHYIYTNSASVSFKTDKSINNAPTSKTSYLIDSSYTDADSFKASIQGQILYYELETPEVYELDFPINTSYEAYDFGTEEVLYGDDKEVNIPMKANIEYGFNAVDMIRNNFKEIEDLKERVAALEQAILQIQAANTSTETPIEL